MKKLLMIVALFTTMKLSAQDKPLTTLLNNYYGIKDALVSGKTTDAAARAGEFVKTLNGVDYKIISEGNVNILLKDAGAIIESKDLAKQREIFSGFSNNMISLAKELKLSDSEIYVQYCPMKKASWLSSEKVIRNPYYGSMMLNCGSVTETIKK